MAKSRKEVSSRQLCSFLYVNDIVNTLPPRVTTPVHADDLSAWTSAEHTSTATHVMQETINRVNSWANEWCMESTAAKHSTVKEKVVLKLENMPVPQVDNPTSLGVTLDTRLTWKTHLKAVAAVKPVSTTWRADTNTSCKGSTQEKSVPSRRMPQPFGPPLQVPTRANWTKSKMSNYEPLLVP